MKLHLGPYAQYPVTQYFWQSFVLYLLTFGASRSSLKGEQWIALGDKITN